MNDVIIPGPQELTAYLLGRASAGDVERLDELSITDDQFAEALDAAEMDLIDSYVNGELSVADREKFEERYMRSGDQSDRVVFANVLQEFASSRLLVMPAVSTSSRFSLFGWTGRTLQFGLAAAALMIAIMGGWFFLSRSGQNANERAAMHDVPVNVALPTNEDRNTQIGLSSTPTNNVGNAQIERPANHAREKELGKSEEPSTQKQAAVQVPRVVAVVLSPQLRSSGAPQKVEVPVGTDQFSARLELESGDFRSYSAVLREQSSNRVIWQSRSTKPTGPRDARRLTVSVPARLVNSGVYTFTVSGNAEIVGEYTFKVVR